MKREDLIAALRSFPYDKKDYWVVAGGAMVLYGLREETSDIDLGCTTLMADRLERDGYLSKISSDGSRCFKVGDIEVFENWLFDRTDTVDGIPVISLEGLLAMKKSLGREKDQKDVEAILAFLEAQGNTSDPAGGQQ